MPADLTSPFGECCSDGGATYGYESAQSCGCDPGANWYCSVYPNCSFGSRIVSNPTGGRVDLIEHQLTEIGRTPTEYHMTTKNSGSGPITSGPFTIKDSGVRQTFSGGMQRDVTEGKIDYSLVMDGPMFKRWAVHLTNGAKKYDKRNWMKAEGEVEYQRFRESALRHFLQWYWGERDEDHASATMFNINGAEYVLEKKKKAADDDIAACNPEVRYG